MATGTRAPSHPQQPTQKCLSVCLPCPLPPAPCPALPVVPFPGRARHATGRGAVTAVRPIRPPSPTRSPATSSQCVPSRACLPDPGHLTPPQPTPPLTHLPCPPPPPAHAAWRTMQSAALGDVRVGTDCRPHGVIGQHIAQKLVPAVLVEHYRRENPPPKPLVLSFFGSPGVGKTFFETALRSSLFARTDADGNGDGVLVLSGKQAPPPPLCGAMGATGSGSRSTEAPPSLRGARAWAATKRPKSRG